jgi:hypothetical protein
MRSRTPFDSRPIRQFGSWRSPYRIFVKEVNPNCGMRDVQYSSVDGGAYWQAAKLPAPGTITPIFPNNSATALQAAGGADGRLQLDALLNCSHRGARMCAPPTCRPRRSMPPQRRTTSVHAICPRVGPPLAGNAAYGGQADQPSPIGLRNLGLRDLLGELVDPLAQARDGEGRLAERDGGARAQHLKQRERRAKRLQRLWPREP